MKLNHVLLLLLNLATVQAHAGDIPVGTSKEGAQNERQQQAATDNQIIITEEQFTNLGINTDSLEPINEVPLLYVPGQVVIPPNNDYIVSAAQAGLVSKLNVAIGDRVEQAQVLAVIHSPDLLALQRQYLKAVSEQQLAGAVYRRDKKLLAEGVISSSRFEQARSRYNIANSEAHESAQLLGIAGMTETAIKRLASQRRLSSELEVYSPITGVVLDKMVSVGARLGGQTPIYRVADIEQLWLEIKIPQERIGDIKVGDLVRVENTSVLAEISLLGQSVDPKNQTILARAIITGSQSQVRAGQSVNTKIIKAVDGPAFKVPNEAIAQREGHSYIFVRNAQGFEVRPVQVIGKQDAESIIGGELSGNEMIAVRGGVALKANWMGLGSEE
ncbi:MAG: efflux RND transporter periplasmic adaptor subunit [Gammaproteobacteria bacterium]